MDVSDETPPSLPGGGGGGPPPPPSVADGACTVSAEVPVEPDQEMVTITPAPPEHLGSLPTPQVKVAFAVPVASSATPIDDPAATPVAARLPRGAAKFTLPVPALPAASVQIAVMLAVATPSLRIVVLSVVTMTRAVVAGGE